MYIHAPSKKEAPNLLALLQMIVEAASTQQTKAREWLGNLFDKIGEDGSYCLSLLDQYETNYYFLKAHLLEEVLVFGNAAENKRVFREFFQQSGIVGMDPVHYRYIYPALITVDFTNADRVYHNILHQPEASIKELNKYASYVMQDRCTETDRRTFCFQVHQKLGTARKRAPKAKGHSRMGQKSNPHQNDRLDFLPADMFENFMDKQI